MDMTKRETLKSSRSILARFSLGSFISLIVGAISLVFALPMGQTFMDLFAINVQIAALILSIV
jgi:ABC-type dipeptide/oligopeptide/nickel transport system permease subunit